MTDMSKKFPASAKDLHPYVVKYSPEYALSDCCVINFSERPQNFQFRNDMNVLGFNFALV